MNIRVTKKNFDRLNTAVLKGRCEEALDSIWKETWLNMSITKSDRKNLEEISGVAEEIASKSDTAVFVCDGALAKTLKAVLTAVGNNRQGMEILVFGDTLSAQDYAEMTYKLENSKPFMIVATDGEVSLQTRGAYATIKKLLISKYGAQTAADRIIACAPKAGKFLAEEATNGDFPLMAFPENVSGECCANTDIVILALAIAAADIESYLEGFCEMIASPSWDVDATDYAVAKAAYVLEGGQRENICFWQSELEELCNLQFTADTWGRALKMPEFAGISGCKDSFRITFLVENEAEDVIMPFFDGCNEDGSLNLLLRSEALKKFQCNDEEIPQILIEIQSLSAYNLGQIMAFCQLSNRVFEYLCK